MSDQQLKTQIIETLWQVVDRQSSILSATLTGSFVNSPSLDGLSDIDFVVVVDQLNRDGFAQMQEQFRSALAPVLESAGYSLRLNPTLGPLKFNAPRLAVLHLMFYSRQAHIDHVINSPFTCLDWQQSPYFRKASLADIYPAFGLQPRHFLSARRSITDYLHDYRHSIVSYRELDCDDSGYTERKCQKTMDSRDRHEFAYHVIRFLMLNLLKLTRKYDQTATRLETLMDRYFQVFPADQAATESLLGELAAKKRKVDYVEPIELLDRRLENFVAVFERQFRRAFIENATRHIVFRHAETALNRSSPEHRSEIRFLGRSNPDILSQSLADRSGWESVAAAIERTKPTLAYCSPLARCRQSLAEVWSDGRPVLEDARIVEMNYGDCEALTVSEVRSRYPSLFESWKQSDDPRFPNGENSADVLDRSLEFARDRWLHDGENSLVCTHNVVLRSLIGEALGVPVADRYRIRVPHVRPIEFIATEQHGLLIDLNEELERELFAGFANP